MLENGWNDAPVILLYTVHLAHDLKFHSELLKTKKVFQTLHYLHITIIKDKAGIMMVLSLSTKCINFKLRRTNAS